MSVCLSGACSACIPVHAQHGYIITELQRLRPLQVTSFGLDPLQNLTHIGMVYMLQ